MRQKFDLGQKVKIVSRGKGGAKEIEKYIGKSGEVFDCSWYGLGANTPYLYKIRFAKDYISGVPEDALEPAK